MNAAEILDALKEEFSVAEIGVSSNIGTDLMLCGRTSCGNWVDFTSIEKYDSTLASGRPHTIDYYALPLSKWMKQIAESCIEFKKYQFISLADAAYHLKTSISELEEYAAELLLEQVLNAGLRVIKKESTRDFKMNSLEELYLRAALRQCRLST